MIIHVLIWSIPMAVFAWIVVYKTQEMWPLKWWLSILPLHFLVEWPLNRYTTSLMMNKNVRMAITVIHAEKMIVNIGIILLLAYFSE